MVEKAGQPCFVSVLEQICKNEVVSSEKCDQETLKTLVKTMKEERRITGKILHGFEFVVFTWQINAEVMKKAIENIKVDE